MDQVTRYKQGYTIIRRRNADIHNTNVLFFHEMLLFAAKTFNMVFTCIIKTIEMNYWSYT